MKRWHLVGYFWEATVSLTLPRPCGVPAPHVDPPCWCLSGHVGDLLQREVGRADRRRPVHRGRHQERVSQNFTSNVKVWPEVLIINRFSAATFTFCSETISCVKSRLSLTANSLIKFLQTQVWTGWSVPLCSVLMVTSLWSLAVKTLLRTSTVSTTRWESTASSPPACTWPWAPSRSARCDSTSGRSTWWHKERRRHLTSDLQPPNETLRGQKIHLQSNLRVNCGQPEWLNINEGAESGVPWIIYFEFLCLLLVFVVDGWKVESFLWWKRPNVDPLWPQTADLFICWSISRRFFGREIWTSLNNLNWDRGDGSSSLCWVFECCSDIRVHSVSLMWINVLKWLKHYGVRSFAIKRVWLKL